MIEFVNFYVFRTSKMKIGMCYKVFFNDTFMLHKKIGETSILDAQKHIKWTSGVGGGFQYFV